MNEHFFCVSDHSGQPLQPQPWEQPPPPPNSSTPWSKGTTMEEVMVLLLDILNTIQSQVWSGMVSCPVHYSISILTFWF